MKKHRIRPIKMVTVGMINRSTSIRAAETWYFAVMSAVDEEAFIYIGLPVEPVERVVSLSPLKNESCRILSLDR